MTPIERLTVAQLEQLREAKSAKLAYLKANPFKSKGAGVADAQKRVENALNDELSAISAVLASRK